MGRCACIFAKEQKIEYTRQMFDLTIIGGGPAGVAAGVYAARKQLKTLFIAKEFGGQSVVSDEIQNWIGTDKISGIDLAKKLEGHLRAYAGDFVTIKDALEVLSVSKLDEGFTVETTSGSFETKTVLITTGSSRRKLTMPGAAEFDGRGISYCASCDGPIYAGGDVVVVGGGNAAFESAAQLLAYCKSVTLLNRTENFKADEVTVKKVSAHPNFKILTNVETISITGDKFVSGLTYKNINTGEENTLAVTGVFVEIGAIPATGFVKDLVNLNAFGAVVTDPKNQAASVEGIWAAGDCTDGLYHQNNIAAGDAVKALEDIYLYLKAK
jgi:alkyl hydroperoxide reductase subunit F